MANPPNDTRKPFLFETKVLPYGVVADSNGAPQQTAALALTQRGEVFIQQVAQIGDGTGDPASGNLTAHIPTGLSSSPISYLALDINSYNRLFNGSTWDDQRNNLEASILASAARTASVNSSDQTNYNARGLHIIINVTSITATPSITPTIQGKDPVSNAYYDILVGSAITTTGTTVLKVYPGIGTIPNGAASDILPRTWRVSMAHADADSITYSVGATLTL